MKKRLLAMSMALLMAAGLTVGCGGGTAETPATQAPETQKDGGETTQAQASGGGESGEQVTIRFAGWLEVEEATSQLFKDLIAGFEAENPDIKVETVAIPFNNFKDQVMIAANSGDAADVIMGNDQMMSAFNGAQILQPLEGVLDQAVIDDLIPVYKEATMYDGKLCSVAWMPHPVAMFYNKDLFAKAGLDPEAPPKTWDEMIDAIAKISALGEDENGNRIYGLAIPNGKGSHAAQRFQGIVYSYGGNFLDDTGMPNVETPEYKEAFQFLKDMADQGYMPECVDAKDARSLFATGVAGITFESEMGRNIYRTTSGLGEEFDKSMGVALFPVNKTGESTTINTRHELGIYAQSKHKEAAAKLVEYLLSEEAAVMYYDAQDAMSPRVSISQLPEMNKDDYSRIFNEQSATAKPVKITNALFDNAMSEMSKSMERVLVNHEDIDTVLADLQKTVTDLYQ